MSDFINIQKRCDALDRINNTMGKIKLIQELASHPESVAALNHRHRLDLDAVEALLNTCEALEAKE